MPYFVSPGRSITTPRGIVAADSEDSEITWQRLCRNANDKDLVKTAKRQIGRLLDAKAIMEADEAPLSREEAEAAEAASRIGEQHDLASAQPAKRKLGKKKAAKKRAAKPQSVDMANAGKEPIETAPVSRQSVDMSGVDVDAEAPSGAEGGAQRAEAPNPKGE